MSEKTNAVKLHSVNKDVTIGSGNPVVVQTMLNKKPDDVEGNIEQALDCVKVGCEVIRFSVPNEVALITLKELILSVPIPIVADIHFNHEMAIASAEAGAAKIRINPGNIGGFDKTREVVEVCKKTGCAIRVGVNAGSLEKEIAEREDLSFEEKLCESAKQYCDFVAGDCDFENLVVSIKAHDVMSTVKANRLFSEMLPEIPLHIGITEAGSAFQGLIKSGAGLGILLSEGIGDTIRISLTDDPQVEVRAAWQLLSALNLRRRGVEIISCPTCARTEVDIIGIVREVEERLATVTKPVKVAIMGCVVNGPGEAADADVGVACGRGSAVLFSRGKIIKKVPECEIVDALLEEVENR